MYHPAANTRQCRQARAKRRAFREICVICVRINHLCEDSLVRLSCPRRVFVALSRRISTKSLHKQIKTTNFAALSERRHMRIVLWCNGSTTGFGSVCLGSNPGRTTQKAMFKGLGIKRHHPMPLDFFVCSRRFSSEKHVLQHKLSKNMKICFAIDAFSPKFAALNSILVSIQGEYIY